MLGSDVHPLSPSPHILLDLQKGAPLTDPAKRDAPFPEPSTISKIPSQRTPQVPQWAPTERDTRFQSLLLHIPSPCSPNRVSTERDAPSPEPMVYSFIYICQSPHLRSPTTKWRKNIRSPSTGPHTHRRSTYNGVQSGSPRGLFMTLLAQPQCHAGFSLIPSTLAWAVQCHVSQCVLQ